MRQALSMNDLMKSIDSSYNIYEVSLANPLPKMLGFSCMVGGDSDSIRLII